MFFVTAYMGGGHGTAKSARDFLRAMLACVPVVNVVSPGSEEFPNVMCGRQLINPEWFEPYGGQLPNSFWRWRPELLRRFFHDRAMKNRIKKSGCSETVIVNGWASYDYWQSVAGWFDGRKVMVVRESPRHFDGPDHYIHLQHLLRGLAAFDALIFVSDRLRQEWLGFDMLMGKPAGYLPNCCEEEDVEELRKLDKSAVREAFGFGENEFIVICPGTIEHRKGHDLLVDIVPALAASIGHLRVVFVGDAATEWAKELIENIERGEIARWCAYMNSRPDILDLLYASDVLAFPSRAEAMPRTILEAMALGTPIVAAAVDGVPELIEDGLTGILFSSGDKNGLVEGLLAMAHNRENGEKMADLARARYWDNFSRKHQFDRMEEILNRPEITEDSKP